MTKRHDSTNCLGRALCIDPNGCRSGVLPVAYINTTSVTVGGLAEHTTYYFQVYAGDSNGYDTNFYTPAPQATTLIMRTTCAGEHARTMAMILRPGAHTCVRACTWSLHSAVV